MESSEFDFINLIRNRARNAHNDLIQGIGDDAAVLREETGRESLVTTDLLVEDIDFKLEYAPPHWLGHKSLAVSLSDIAAMGGTPKYSLLSLGIPKKLSALFWDEFFDGYFLLARRYGVDLIGGDISLTKDGLTIDSIVLGRCSSGKTVRRSGARVGDSVYVTGSLGASAAGLKLLLDGARVDESENSLRQAAIRAHLKPEPRIAFGRIVGEQSLAHSMIDVSDGLAQDLKHICDESRVAAIIDFDSMPIAREITLVESNRAPAFELAVNGGEDFELLLTANMDSEKQLFDAADDCRLNLTRIGEVIERRDDSNPVLLRSNDHIKPLVVHGYDHFRI